MTTNTTKYGLTVAESGDPADMPTYTATAMGTVEAALDQVAGDAKRLLSSRVAKSGDSMTGDLQVSKASPLIRVNSTGGNATFGLGQNGNDRWAIEYNVSDNNLRVLRKDASGAFQSSPIRIEPDGDVFINTDALVIRANGKVESKSHVGGEVKKTTDANGDTSIPLPTSPTGKWAVTVSAETVLGNVALVPAIIDTGASHVGVKIINLFNQNKPLPNTAVTLHYTAIAY